MKVAWSAGLAFCLATAAGSGMKARRVWSDSNTNLLGGPSRDGRLLSFVDARTGDLAIRDMETGSTRRLTRATPETKSEFAYFSAISPDSRLVAYAWFNQDRFYDLRVIEIDKPAPRVLFRNEEAGFVQPCAWSPDGKWILTLLFRKDNISQIALVSARDGTVRVLRSLNWVYPKKMDFSPDGRFIVYDNFARDSADQRDIFILSVDGSTETTAIRHPANDLFPLWSPAGDYLYFASDRSGTMDAWRVPVREGAVSGEPALVERNLGRYLPMGMTEGGRLFYGLNTGATDVFAAGIVAPPVSAPRRLSVRFPGRNTTPAITQDGETVAFLSRRGTENYGQASRVITIRRLKDDSDRDLTPKLAHLESLAFSPDGTTLLVAGSDAKGRSGLFLVSVENGSYRPLIHEAEAPFRGFPASWLDSNHVVFARGARLVRIAVDTGEASEVAEAQGEITRVAASNAGIAYCTRSCFLLKDGKTEPLPFEGQVRSLTWNAAGLMAATDKKLLLWGGAEVRRVAMPEEFEGEAAMAPDGASVIFAAGRLRQEVWVLEHAPESP